MSGYRGGSSQSLSAKAFNERAKALSARLGPVERAEKPSPASRQKRFDLPKRGPSEPAVPAAEDAAPADDAAET